MWVLYALLAAIFAAVVTTLSKAGLKDTESSLAFAIQSILIIIVSWSVVLIQGNAQEISRIDRKTWIYLIIAGIFTSFSSLFTFRALKIGDASVVNPIERTSLVFAIILAAIFLKEKITWQIATGALLIIAGAILIALSKKSS
ncbi:MAG: EamA family transporter [Chitinophagaceae bacterium]|nr:EamA family transporter [Chitinophagaceae bacterium]